MQCKMMTTLPNPISAQIHSATQQPWWHVPLYGEGLMRYYIYVLYEEKKIGKWRPDMTSTGWGFSWSAYHICQSVLPEVDFSLAPHLQSQFIAKAIGLRRSVISRPLSRFSLSFPVLIVTCACPLLQSSDIQTHWEWGNSKLCGISLPCLAKTPFSTRLFRALCASAFLIPSLSHGHGLLTLCMVVCVDFFLCPVVVFSVWKCVRVNLWLRVCVCVCFPVWRFL